jgi:hypothetical protein
MNSLIVFLQQAMGSRQDAVALHEVLRLQGMNPGDFKDGAFTISKLNFLHLDPQAFLLSAIKGDLETVAPTAQDVPSTKPGMVLV